MAVPTSTIDITNAATAPDIFFTTLLLVYFSGVLPPNIFTKSSRQDAVVAGQTFWSQRRQANTVGSPAKEGALLNPHTIKTRMPINPNDPQMYRIMFPFFASILVPRPPYAPSSKRHATRTQMAATPYMTRFARRKRNGRLWKQLVYREYSPSNLENILHRWRKSGTVQQRRFAAAADARKRPAKCAIAHKQADDS
ncbi:MAG: hypothetical protein WC256_07610 [Desulfurivibrionaceae bacterium]|jgi:hypothetical protein